MPRISAGYVAYVVMLCLAASPRVVSAEMVSVNLEAVNDGVSNIIASTLEATHETHEVDSAQTMFMGTVIGELDIDFSGPDPVVNNPVVIGEFAADWEQTSLQVLLGVRLDSPITVLTHLPPYRVPIGIPADPENSLLVTITTEPFPSPPTEPPDPYVIPRQSSNANFSLNLIGSTQTTETYQVTMNFILKQPGTHLADEINCSICNEDAPLSYLWVIDLPTEIVATGEFTRVVPEPGSLAFITIGGAVLLRRRSTSMRELGWTPFF